MSEQTSAGSNGAGVENAAIQAAALNAANPAEEINKAFAGNQLYSNTAITYKFKTPRKVDGKPATDQFGNELTARAPVILTVPVPTWEGLRNFVDEANPNRDKNRNWLLDIIQDVVKEAVKDQVYDEANPVNSQDELKTSVLTLDFLVDVPKTERTGRGIPKETWDEWAADYKDVMGQLGARSAEKIGNAAEAFVKKFNPVKTNKKLVEFLLGELNNWATITNNLEEYMGIFEFLKKRAQDIIDTNPEKMMENFQ